MIPFTPRKELSKGGKEEWEKRYSLPLQSITDSGIVTFLVHLTNGARKKGHLHGKKKKPTSVTFINQHFSGRVLSLRVFTMAAKS